MGGSLHGAGEAIVRGLEPRSKRNRVHRIRAPAARACRSILSLMQSRHTSVAIDARGETPYYVVLTNPTTARDRLLCDAGRCADRRPGALIALPARA